MYELLSKRISSERERQKKRAMMSPENGSYSLDKLPEENFPATEDCSQRRETNFLSDEKSYSKPTVTKLKAFLGLFFIFLHVIFTQLISVIVKNLSYISTSQLSLIRNVGNFLFILPLAVYCNKNILGEKKKWLLLAVRGLLAATGLFLQLVAYRYLQLVEVSIVMATLPFFTAILARIFLKEPLGVILTITLITTICGVLLSLRLPEVLNDNRYSSFDASFTIGLITSLGCVICLALGTVALRKLKEVHFSTVVLYLSFFGMVENAVLNGTVFPLVKIECGWDQILCMFVAICAAAESCFFTLATQAEPATLVVLQKCSFDILITTVFQILFFTMYPDVYVISGASLVLISLTVIGVKNWVLTMPETSTKRQKLKWILL